MGHVYLMNMVDTDLYKIGHTTRKIENRINEIQTGNPNVIELVSLFETKYYVKVEARMHHVHSSKRLEGEWFELSETDTDNFKKDCQKCVDIFETLDKSDNPYFNL